LEHPVLTVVQRAGFVPLGWFTPNRDDGVPGDPKFAILIGNAGPGMFRRFARERRPETSTLDAWTRSAVLALAEDLDARAHFPFDKPPLPFLRWARRAGAGHVSPLGLNIHARYGLWHAYRAALAFTVEFDLPKPSPGEHPCEGCAGKPCLSACPVDAFTANGYDVQSCGRHLLSPSGEDCMANGCRARLACPIGRAFIYETPQIRFHMDAFRAARIPANGQSGGDQG
jgi:epoxyqueuosine reductase QueG